MNIGIKIEERKPIVEGSPRLVCGNSGDTITFNFDSEWDEYVTRVARFVYVKNGVVEAPEVLFNGNVVEIPVLSNITEVFIGVFAGELRTTTPVTIPCDLSILCKGGKTVDPTPDIYAQILDALNAKLILEGNAQSATKLETPRNIQVDLEKSTGVDFDGTEDVTIGVNGVLPIEKGGTGATNPEGVLNNLGVDLSLYAQNPVKRVGRSKAITIADSGKSPFANLKLYGETTQFTTTGKNKLPPYDMFYNTDLTITKLADGGYKISGQPDHHQFTICDDLIPTGLVEGETYIFSSNNSDIPIIVEFISTAGTVARMQNSEFTVPSGYHQLFVVGILDTDKTYNTTIYPMIRPKGTDDTYEEYTGGIPSPNPNYPQELKSVGDSGSFSVGVYGKNLVDYSKFKQQNYATDPTITIKGNIVELYANANGFYIDDCFMRKGVTYIITGKVTNIVNFRIFRKGDWLNTVANVVYDPTTGGIGCIYTPTYDDEVIRIWVSNQTAVLTNFMVREVNTTDVYELPCNKQTLTMPYTLRSVGDIKDEVDFNRGVLIQRIKKVVIDGNSITTYIAGDLPYVMSTRTRDWAKIANTYMCDSYRVISVNERYQDKTMFINGSGDLALTNTDFTSQDVAVSMLNENPVTVIYRLATPIETPLSETELNAYRQLMTNSGTTTILSEAESEVDYYTDTLIGDTLGNLRSSIYSGYETLKQAIVSLGGEV